MRIKKVFPDHKINKEIHKNIKLELFVYRSIIIGYAIYKGYDYFRPPPPPPSPKGFGGWHCGNPQITFF